MVLVMKKFLLMVVLSVVLSINLFAAFNVVNIRDEFGELSGYKMVVGWDTTQNTVIRFGVDYVDLIFASDYVMTKSDLGLIKFRNEKGVILQYLFYFENGDSANLYGEEVAELEDFFKKSSYISIAIVDYKNRTWNYEF